ncbi:MAG: rRNA maturation RNase YbeY [Gammaproteobacteria bacterium]|nr:rRNA maturation RNase YbeY [Gammaproteobacteria bacterium]
MTVTVEVSLSDDLISEIGESGDDDVPEPGLLQEWATAAYLKKTPAIASMLVTTADDIQKLNKQYRHKDSATNVLSFPMESPEEIDVCLLGDIVLCASVIEQEAKQQSKTKKSHWAHMVVHGMLHLQGYDHIDDAAADEMEQLEINILDKLGFDSPYEHLTDKETK